MVLVVGFVGGVVWVGMVSAWVLCVGVWIACGLVWVVQAAVSGFCRLVCGRLVLVFFVGLRPLGLCVYGWCSSVFGFNGLWFRVW